MVGLIVRVKCDFRFSFKKLNWSTFVCIVLLMSTLLNTFDFAECSANFNLWMCLKCGKLNCSRYANGHALRHYELNNEHEITISTETTSVYWFVISLDWICNHNCPCGQVDDHTCWPGLASYWFVSFPFFRRQRHRPWSFILVISFCYCHPVLREQFHAQMIQIKYTLY